MYICPTCGQELSNEDNMRKHMLACWKELHPYHQSKSAPHSEDIVTKEVDNDVLDFFSSLKESK